MSCTSTTIEVRLFDELMHRHQKLCTLTFKILAIPSLNDTHITTIINTPSRGGEREQQLIKSGSRAAAQQLHNTLKQHTLEERTHSSTRTSTRTAIALATRTNKLKQIIHQLSRSVFEAL